jgi:hypothetical protein
MTHRTLIRGAGALVAVALPLAACGSSGSPSGSTGVGKRAALVTFARCMRANGVSDFPDPTGRGGLSIDEQRSSSGGSSLSVNGVTVNAPAFQSAMRTCLRDLPNGGQPQPLSASRRAEVVRFAQCMRTHGLSGFPDPTFQGGRVGFDFGNTGINPNSPAFRTAQAACGSNKSAVYGAG